MMDSPAAPCGCVWDGGTWYPCVDHAVTHRLHRTPAPGCSLCDVEFDEDCADETYTGDAA